MVYYIDAYSFQFSYLISYFSTKRQELGLFMFVLFEGNMKREEIKFLGSKQVEEGTLIDLKEANGVVFRAQTDCQMIRIKKNPILSLYEKKIIKFQR